MQNVIFLAIDLNHKLLVYGYSSGQIQDGLWKLAVENLRTL
jgi:hypothetical protein